MPSDAVINNEQNQIKQIVRQVLNNKLSQLRVERGLSRDPTLLVTGKQGSKFLPDFPSKSIFKRSSLKSKRFESQKHSPMDSFTHRFRDSPNKTVSSHIISRKIDVQDVESTKRTAEFEPGTSAVKATQANGRDATPEDVAQRALDQEHSR